MSILSYMIENTVDVICIINIIVTPWAVESMDFSRPEC